MPTNMACHHRTHRHHGRHRGYLGGEGSGGDCEKVNCEHELIFFNILDCNATLWIQRIPFSARVQSRLRVSESGVVKCFDAQHRAGVAKHGEWHVVRVPGVRADERVSDLGPGRQGTCQTGVHVGGCEVQTHGQAKRGPLGFVELRRPDSFPRRVLFKVAVSELFDARRVGKDV